LFFWIGNAEFQVFHLKQRRQSFAWLITVMIVVIQIQKENAYEMSFTGLWCNTHER
jgi:uncharacterized membrane protein (DUF485 family)